MKIIQQHNLHEDDFIGISDGTNVDVRVKVSDNPSNQLKRTSKGLEVLPAQNVQVDEYSLTPNTNIVPTSEIGNKIRISNSNMFGQIHLDFTYNAEPVREWPGYKLFTLSPQSPTSKYLIELMIDVNNESTIWLDPRSREIFMKAPIKGKRYIVDLHGFFEES